MSDKIKTEIIEVGDEVTCDLCCKDWTDSDVSGGMMFSGYALCPECAVSKLASIKAYGEERFITEHCPPDLSFADWIRRMRYRTGNDKVLIQTRE